jgi:hypothetical protein
VNSAMLQKKWPQVFWERCYSDKRLVERDKQLVLIALLEPCQVWVLALVRLSHKKNVRIVVPWRQLWPPLGNRNIWMDSVATPTLHSWPPTIIFSHS